MDGKEIDARGLTCPIPVVRTKQAITENPGEKITVLVETAVSRENVSRLAKSLGYSVAIEKVADEFRISLTPPAK